MPKPSITKRTAKGTALTYDELDANFQNLADATVSLTAGTGGTAVTADLNGNITLVAGTNITLTGNNTTKTITINSTGGSTNATTINITNATQDNNEHRLVMLQEGLTGQQALYSDANIYYYPQTDQLVVAGSVNTLNVIASGEVRTSTITNPSGATVTISDRLIVGPSGNIQIGYEAGGTHRIECTGPLLIATELTFNGSAQGPRINMGNGPNGGSISIGKDADPDDKIYLTDVVNLGSLTTTQRNALVNPQNGDLIYNTTTNKFQGYAGSAWVDLH